MIDHARWRASVFQPDRRAPCAGAAGRRVLGALLLTLLLSTWATGALAFSTADTAAATAQRIVIAVAERAEPAPAIGSTPRGYSGLQSYTGGDRAVATAAALARDYDLQEVSSWTIDPLRLRCMLYQPASTVDRTALFARLRQDPRVRLVQPLQTFDTYTAPAPATALAPPPVAPASAFNDPYNGLQHGFSSIGAGAAQHYSSGAGVRIAVIDTGIDAAHADLAGRIVSQSNFVDTADAAGMPPDRHGTEVAGVIAAVANNGVGIVGVAPSARILSYRACWPVSVNASAARCDSFTLARALGAAIASGAPIINLSLGGPADPLLEQLLAYAVKRGTIVVGAVPPSGRLDGFPVDVPGVIAVDSAEQQHAGSAVLGAPGRDILTLEPGGGYDYASGSSLATAHVSGAIALLLALDRSLDAPRITALLQRSEQGAGAPINVCTAEADLGRAAAACDERPARAE